MCGIAGLWGSGDIQVMVDLITHRGPDGEGIYRGNPVHLGARSLKITDPNGKDQPFFSEDKSIAVVLNGEIYNYQEIKTDLNGHVFYTNTDTEMIAHAYQVYGLDCVHKFNGMFAFAIWDGKKLILGRDRMGQKPLYYYHKAGRFFFGSEIKSILSQIEAKPNITENFRVFETPVDGETLFQDVYSLPPACLLIYDGEKISIQKYWQINPESATTLSETACIEQLRWLIQDSVRLRCPSQVPMGIFLSGGIDSSLLAYLAKPQVAYTCNYQLEGIYNELELAEAVARDIGAKHTVIRPSAPEFQARFKKMMWHLDQPVATAAAFSTFLLAEAASDSVKVILNGEGSDELFNGYVRHLLMAMEERMGKMPEIKDYHSLARFFWSSKMFGNPAERYYDLTKRGLADTSKPFNLFDKIFKQQRHLLNALSATDIEITLPPLLTMADRVCSAFGVENRSPFLDYRIVEFAFSLPPEMRIRDNQTKYIVRQVARGIVPDKIIDRKDKQGLVTPVMHWLNHELAPWTNALLEKSKKRDIPFKPGLSRGQYDRYTYMMISLEYWYQLFIDQSHLRKSRDSRESLYMF